MFVLERCRRMIKDQSDLRKQASLIVTFSFCLSFPAGDGGICGNDACKHDTLMEAASL
jgi:hypothetical protein